MWMADAACRGATPMFFADRFDGEAVANARAVCDSCSVWSECLDYAMTANAPRHGVLAGLTADERTELRRDCPLGTTVPIPTERSPRGAMPHLCYAERPPQTWTRRQLLELRAAAGC